LGLSVPGRPAHLDQAPLQHRLEARGRIAAGEIGALRERRRPRRAERCPEQGLGIDPRITLLALSPPLLGASVLELRRREQRGERAHDRSFSMALTISSSLARRSVDAPLGNFRRAPMIGADAGTSAEGIPRTASPR